MGGRMAATHQTIDTLTKMLRRTLAEGLISIVGEGVGLNIETEYPTQIPRAKKVEYTSFVWECTAKKDYCTGLVKFDNALCCALQEKVCGGTGEIVENAEKIDILTPTESRFAERITTIILEQLARLVVVDDSFRLVKSRDGESRLSFKANMCLFKMHVYTASFSGPILVWLPEELITSANNDKVGRGDLMEVIGELPLDVNAILSRRTTTLGSVFSLKVGDDLPLSIPNTAEVYAGSVLLGHARIVAKNSLLALELEKIILG